MSNPLAAAAAALPLEDPVPAEQPRPGDPGGEPCRYCPVTDEDAIWSNSHWRAVPRAHFHVHFIPRPLGRPQFGWRNLPFLEDRYPHPGEDHHTAAAKAIGAYLAAGSPRPGNRPAD